MVNFTVHEYSIPKNTVFFKDSKCKSQEFTPVFCRSSKAEAYLSHSALLIPAVSIASSGERLYFTLPLDS